MTIDERRAKRSARIAQNAAATAQYLANFCRTEPRAIFMTVDLGLAGTPSGAVFEALLGDDIAVYRNDAGVATFISRRLSDDDLNQAMAALAAASSGWSTMNDMVTFARNSANAAVYTANQALTGDVQYSRMRNLPQVFLDLAAASAGGSGLLGLQGGLLKVITLASSTDIAVTTSPDGVSKAFALNTNGVMAGTYGGAALVPVLNVDATGRITAITAAAVMQRTLSQGVGVVVAYDIPSNTYTISVPILDVKAANMVLAGPVSGATAPPAFRSLVAADLPPVVEFPLLVADPSPKANTVLGYMSATTQRLTLMYPDGTKTELGGS